METFSALPALCEGNSLLTGEFSSQNPVTQSFDVFFDLRLNKGFSKQPRRRWFYTSSRPLWRHCNEITSANGVQCEYIFAWRSRDYRYIAFSIRPDFELYIGKITLLNASFETIIIM